MKARTNLELTIIQEMQAEDIRQLRRSQREIEEAWLKFVPAVSNEIASKFVVPYLQRMITLPDTLDYKEKPDPLNIADLNLREKEKG